MNKLLLLSVLALQGCAVVAEYPVATASLVVLGVTGKGPGDHALSYVAERDCNTLRIIEGKKICRDTELAPVLAMTEKTKYSTTTVAMANDVFAQRARHKNELKGSLALSNSRY